MTLHLSPGDPVTDPHRHKTPDARYHARLYDRTHDALRQLRDAEKAARDTAVYEEGDRG